MPRPCFWLVVALFVCVVKSDSDHQNPTIDDEAALSFNDIANATTDPFQSDPLQSDHSSIDDDDGFIVPNSIYAIPETTMEEEEESEDSASLETTTLKTATSSTAHSISPSKNGILQSTRDEENYKNRPFNSALPLIELIVLGCCLIFGIIANCLFVLVLRSDDPIAQRKNWKNLPSSPASLTAKNAHNPHQSMALPSTRVRKCF